MFTEGFGAEQAPGFDQPPPDPNQALETMDPSDFMGSEDDPFRNYIGRQKRYSPEMAGMVIKKAKQWDDAVRSNGLMKQARENFRAYHNADPDGDGYTENSFSVTGENGEILSVRFNELRSLLQLVLNMTVSQKPALQSKAANSEAASLTGAQLWDNVVDFYLSQWRRSRSEKSLMKAVELALINPLGAILMDWDPSAGKDYVPGDNGTPIKTGDLYVKTRSFWDIYFDTNAEDDDELDWIIVRDFENKYNYAAKFPDWRDEILALDTKTDMDRNYRWGWDNETDLIPVYKFYHRSTPALPRGRVVHVLSKELITVDQDNPFIEEETGQAVIPVLFVRAAEGLGTVFGYATANDVGPVQRVYNMIWSGVATNEAAFGIPNITAERGSDISVQTLAGGMNLIEHAPGTQPPQPFSVSSNQTQSLEVLAAVRNQGEKITGANATVRGDPESSLKAASGRALGLIQAMFVQAQSGLQRSYQQLVQDFGNMLLLIVKQFANTPMVTAIAGKDRVMMMGDPWTSATFKGVARVVAEPVNPISKTTAGNKEEAEFLVEHGMVVDPTEYYTVRNTGQLEPLIRPEQTHKNLIHSENSDLLKGLPVPVLRTDKHDKHIEAHLVLLDSPQVRRAGELQGIMAHIAEHESFLQQQMAQAQAAQMQQQAAQQTKAPAQGQKSQTSEPDHGKPSQEKKLALPNGDKIPIPATAQVPGAQ